MAGPARRACAHLITWLAAVPDLYAAFGKAKQQYCRLYPDRSALGGASCSALRQGIRHVGERVLGFVGSRAAAVGIGSFCPLAHVAGELGAVERDDAPWLHPPQDRVMVPAVSREDRGPRRNVAIVEELRARRRCSPPFARARMARALRARGLHLLLVTWTVRWCVIAAPSRSSSRRDVHGAGGEARGPRRADTPSFAKRI